MHRLWWLLLALGCLPQPSMSEIIDKYVPVFVEKSDNSIFFLFGLIDARTALNFDRAIEEFGVPELVVLSSDGGLVDQALNVARSVRRNGVNTLVPADGGCYSACALIFLAGRIRVADGQLGVHQISSSTGDLESGQLTISDILDVLGDFDVPNDLLVDMFRTAPEGMHVLSDEEKLAYGFTLRDVDQRSSDPGPSLEAQAFKVLMDYNQSWSQGNETALFEVMEFYGETVQFYGKPYSTAQLLAEKRAFAERWPERFYTVDGDSVSVSCQTDFCLAKGNVRWLARSPNRGKTSRGVAYFEFTIEFVAGRPRIVAENGHVLSRE
jgi:hypothetical protein